MKIGIPRAGLYYKFFPLWDTFFKEVGVEPVYSPTTNEAILKKGLEIAHSDICFPMKVFFGHTWWLVKCCPDLNGDTPLFIPRVISLEPKRYLCPKFIGLPDMIRASIPELPPIIDVNLNLRNSTFKKFWLQVGKRLRIPADKVEKALAKAIQREANYKWNNTHKDKSSTQDLRIGIVARPYITYDEYISVEIVKRLKANNITVYTNEDIPQEVIHRAISGLNKPIYFNMGEENVGTAFHFLNSNDVDGFIYLIAFDCGPDSLLKELIDDHATKSKIPYTTIILDEHTGIAGIMTRVEAFIDMVRYRKKM